MSFLEIAKIRQLCNLEGAVRLVIALGYPKEGDSSLTDIIRIRF